MPRHNEEHRPVSRLRLAALFDVERDAGKLSYEDTIKIINAYYDG